DSHVRLSSTYELACSTESSLPIERPPAAPGLRLASGGKSTAAPFTLTVKPSPAHAGRRTANVKSDDLGLVSVIFAVSPSGNPVSIASAALCIVSCAVEGTNRFTQ